MSIFHQYQSVILKDSPSNAYAMNETTGSTATDFAGSVNGTYYGATLNQSGPAFDNSVPSVQLNGNSGLVSCGSIGNYTTSNFTIEGWYNFTSFANTPFPFSNGSYQNYGYYLQLGSANATFDANQSGTIQSATGNIGFSTGQWYHIVITKNGSTVTQYVNAVSAGSGTVSNPASSSSAFQFGAYQNVFYSAMKMCMGAVYPSALAQPRIIAHYKAMTSPRGSMFF